MEFVHHCTFCGWSRTAGGAAIAAADRCANCGCGLSSSRSSDVARHQPTEVEELDAALPRLHATTASRIGAVAFLVLLVSAAFVGYSHGGAPIAFVTAGLAGLAGSGLAFEPRGQSQRQTLEAADGSRVALHGHPVRR
ncbi:MAG TPA: hypothetical protein VNT32_03655 [Thermoleophilaceae bacterium]|nr:hypothetical protein [Thermoleophilaceae bacterium]